LVPGQSGGEVSLTKKLTIGIDAANLRGGGGVTHLVELLRAAQAEVHGIDRVVIWGGSETLDLVEDRPWLDKRVPTALDKGLLQRTLWQRYRLSKEVRDAGCDVLFVPGGSYAGDFHPVVNMSRNMLPFEWSELKRYGWSPFTLKLLLLRLTQSRSYKKTDGLIFLTDYARQGVTKVTGELPCKVFTIPHGLNPRFNQAPKQQHAITDYTIARPYRVLYVSTIDQYKHQWSVVEAISVLRREGLPVALDLVGSARSPALKRLNKVIDRLDHNRSWVCYHGSIPFNDLPHRYAQADLGLFASSCENMPNILLETMASGLPIACSNRGPMPEVLGAGGVYFDPEQSADIACALRELITSPQLRSELAQLSYQHAQHYSWKRCAAETIQFLALIAQR
jgi:glycosyltransferase involved in cell wall biosynthesis